MGAGHRLGALVSSNGSCSAHLISAGQAAGEAAAIQAAGCALAQAGDDMLLCSTGMINKGGGKAWSSWVDVWCW